MGLTASRGGARGPVQLVLVRHGESLGNLADDAARESGADALDLDDRDADVRLSGNGEKQAAALGRWVEELGKDSRPTLVVSSPFRRAADTARTVFRDSAPEVILDERLRERDMGVLDGLTDSGVRSRYPDEVDRRERLGKFYYTPPSGESWADVVLRVRSFLAELRDGYDAARVWLFTHQAVIMSFRYALEDLGERRLLEIDGETHIPNASLTVYRRAESVLSLESFADTTAVDEALVAPPAEPARVGGGSRGDG